MVVVRRIGACQSVSWVLENERLVAPSSAVDGHMRVF